MGDVPRATDGCAHTHTPSSHTCTQRHTHKTKSLDVLKLCNENKSSYSSMQEQGVASSMFQRRSVPSDATVLIIPVSWRCNLVPLSFPMLASCLPCWVFSFSLLSISSFPFLSCPSFCLCYGAPMRAKSISPNNLARWALANYSGLTIASRVSIPQGFVSTSLESLLAALIKVTPELI